MNMIMLVGTAGSGKSTLAAAFSEWLKDHDKSIGLVNLDPGVRWLPYSPDIDVRDYVDLEKIMMKYELGPNGALIASMDMMVEYLPQIRREIAEMNYEYLIVDTPGQMEIFAFRSTGPYITSNITEEKMIILCLIDAIFTKQLSNFVSALLLATSVQYRFLKPQINVISKSDMLSLNEKRRIEKWIENPEILEIEVTVEPHVMRRELGRKIIHAIKDEILSDIVFTSSTTCEGFDELYALVERIVAET
ncbi:MAG: ATP/GTP-binding protein [archaeon GB-1867-097]|nr:ATP/GTP-binding protein [Candidatus Culexmicrobium thermophilum]MCS7384393.1 ATP/GTP-binding protein [Candidatus Culexmicrobium thermophilum]HDO20615.1 hypothetical protein [Candidatus Bathyarchaeota archaeon]